MNFSDHLMNVGSTQITENTVVYRVFSKKRLFEMFADRKLTLAAPRKWDDPFENFLSKCKATVDGMPNVKIDNLFKNFYGQCWTLNEDSDAMWRIYSPEKDGARVSTTAGRLLASIYDANSPFATTSYYIGSVSYETEAALRLLFEDPRNASGAAFDGTGKGQAMPLFLKRTEFSHEAEVRLLFRYQKSGSNKVRRQSVWQCPIDPTALFDDVRFDPRMSEKSFRRHEQRLRRLGYTKAISQSTLYKLPNLKITLRSPF
jgi:hypothetical protein